MAVGIALVAAAKAERGRRVARGREGARERRFGRLRGEDLGRELQRIALGQLDLAIELLRGEADVPAEEAVHETRKALKRLRGLMRLLEGEIGRGRAKRERAVLRAAGRRLAGARDAEVLVVTLEGLMARRPRRLGGRRAVAELRGDLRRERDRAAARVREDVASRAQVARELGQLRARVGAWRLEGGRAKRLTEPGLKHIYRKGREGRARAKGRGASPGALHRWRKDVKDLRYALEAVDGGDKRSGRIGKLAQRADRLGEQLGEEHDLAMLEQRVRAHKPLKRRRRARKALLKEIGGRRKKLRKRALRAGRELYEEKPRRFVRRVRAKLPG